MKKKGVISEIWLFHLDDPTAVDALILHVDVPPYDYFRGVVVADYFD